MKAQYDKKHREVVFNKGDWVLLKLQPYHQSTVAQRRNQKLAPRFYGPFPIESQIGTVAYKLTLPDQVKIHAVFHVSKLKKFVGEVPAEPVIPFTQQGHLIPTPKAIID